MKRGLATILIILSLVTATARVFAQQKVNPDGGFSFLSKRLGEKFELLITSPFPVEKEKVYESLTNKRLSELKYVIEKSDMANFENATIRYATSVGEWVGYINKKQLLSEKQRAADTLTSQIPVINTLMSKYDPTTAEWRFVKHDLDYINIYISQLK